MGTFLEKILKFQVSVGSKQMLISSGHSVYLQKKIINNQRVINWQNEHVTADNFLIAFKYQELVSGENFWVLICRYTDPELASLLNVVR